MDTFFSFCTFTFFDIRLYLLIKERLMLTLIFIILFFAVYVPARRGIQQFILDVAPLFLLTAALIIKLYKALKKWALNIANKQKTNV